MADVTVGWLEDALDIGTDDNCDSTDATLTDASQVYFHTLSHEDVQERGTCQKFAWLQERGTLLQYTLESKLQCTLMPPALPAKRFVLHMAFCGALWSPLDDVVLP